MEIDDGERTFAIGGRDVLLSGGPREEGRDELLSGGPREEALEVPHLSADDIL